MLGIWADYAGGTVPGAALRGAGYVGAIRYVGIGSGAKRLTATELASHQTAGITVLGVAESTATEANNGFGAGVADAKAVLADPLTATLPVIFATNDQPTYTSADVQYVAGFASVLGAARTGAYGFASFLTAVRAAGAATWFWQAGDPPNLTGTDGWVHLWQRQGTPGNGADGPAVPTTLTVAGVSCDINNQLLDFPGADMPLTTADAQLVVNTWLNTTVTDPNTQKPETLGATVIWENNRNISLINAAVATLAQQITAVTGALSQEEAALLAAIKAVPAGAVDAAALAAALETVGFPAALAAAFAAMFPKPTTA